MTYWREFQTNSLVGTPNWFYLQVSGTFIIQLPVHNSERKLEFPLGREFHNKFGEYDKCLAFKVEGGL